MATNRSITETRLQQVLSALHRGAPFLTRLQEGGGPDREFVQHGELVCAGLSEADFIAALHALEHRHLAHSRCTCNPYDSAEYLVSWWPASASVMAKAFGKSPAWRSSA